MKLVGWLFPIDRIRLQDRWTVFLLWAVGVLQGFAQSQAAATVPFTRAALGLTEGQMSLVLAVTRLAGVGAVLFSWWGDKRGRRKPFLVAYTLLIVASAGTALASTPVGFTLAQSVVRLSTAAVGTLGVVLVAERVEPSVRTFSIGLYGAGGSLGAGLGLAVLPLADLGPQAWRLPFALTAVGFLALPMLVRRIDESRLFVPDLAEKARPFRQLLASGFSGRFWLSAWAATLAAAFSTVALTFSTERLIADVGLSTGTAVGLSLGAGTLGGLGFFVGGRLADLIGRRSTTVLALGCMALGGVAVYRSESIPLLAVAITVSTFGSFAYVPAGASHRVELFPTEFRSTAGAAGSYLAMVGSAAGLLLGRITIDRIGLSETVTVLALLPATAMILTLLLPETRGQALDAVKPDR